VIGLIEDIPTCATLIQRIITECQERLRVASSAFGAAPAPARAAPDGGILHVGSKPDRI